MGTDLHAFAPQVADYVLLMHDLIDGRTTDENFAQTYIPRYLNDPTRWPDEIFEVLDRVFAMSESLELDPVERATDDFSRSPEELRESVVEAIAKLDALLNG